MPRNFPASIPISSGILSRSALAGGALTGDRDAGVAV